MLYCDEKSDANIVPVDMCVNGLIASAWDIAERFQNTKTEKDDVELPIYNYESVNEKVHNSLSFPNSMSLDLSLYKHIS